MKKFLVLLIAIMISGSLYANSEIPTTTANYREALVKCYKANEGFKQDLTDLTILLQQKDLKYEKIISEKDKEIAVLKAKKQDDYILWWDKDLIVGIGLGLILGVLIG